ncbi:MAG TPA: amidohydrolase family protein [Polyangiaceae bacterium]|nr:amidohydrolase family protein [Polyangiaceae bacterium]
MLLGSLPFLALGGGGALGWQRLARPAAPDEPLSEAARALVAEAWKGLDPARVVDVHVHVVGIGTGDSGCWVNPRMRSFWHPLEYARFDIYRRAAGIRDLDAADAQYIERLSELARASDPRGRLMLLAFDRVHREDGSMDEGASEFYVPNDHVLAEVERAPDLFLACGSIHPYRKDAVAELERIVERGARAIKWLPSAMRIDPGSTLCDAFYAKAAELGVPILTHGGEERAVEVAEAQELSNPLRLRRALDAGVKVIVAHCASSGEGIDLDSPGNPRRPNFELFLRLIEDGKYRDRLWGEISATTQYNRCDVLPTLLSRSELHPRLVNGSDYPLPAINVLTRTGALLDRALITEVERELLNELDRHNPLLFDFVMKRSLRGPGGERFADRVFMPQGLLRTS